VGGWEGGEGREGRGLVIVWERRKRENGKGREKLTTKKRQLMQTNLINSLKQNIHRHPILHKPIHQITHTHRYPDLIPSQSLLRPVYLGREGRRGEYGIVEGFGAELEDAGYVGGFWVCGECLEEDVATGFPLGGAVEAELGGG
jgi:hypothetical protein